MSIRIKRIALTDRSRVDEDWPNIFPRKALVLALTVFLGT
jgi:hypothetical protein